MLFEKENHQTVVDSLDSLPLILALNSGGEPLNWITYENSAFYAAKNKILWSIGQYEVVLRGGTNAKTGQRSVLTLDTIIALDNGMSPTKYCRSEPALNNKQLFARDHFLCAYCGNQHSTGNLTRDHVLPRSRGGSDIWENVVTSCRPCNQRKDNRTPEEANMKLIYIPYLPSYNETLILKNRRILADQMLFLMKGVSKKSRLHDKVNVM